MSEDRDPLDALFDEPAKEAPAAEIVEVRDPAQEAPVVEDPKPDAPVEGKNDVKDEGTAMVPKAALDEARHQLRELRDGAKPAEKAAEEPTMPSMRDPAEDLPGAFEDLMGAQQFNLINTTLNLSEDLARDKHGDELVDKVREWAMGKFETDAVFVQRILFDRNPFRAAIKEYEEEQQLALVKGLDPEILKGLDEEEIALLKAHRAGKQPAEEKKDESIVEDNKQPRAGDGKFAPVSRSAAPPSASLATTPGSGKSASEVEVGPGVAFDSAFGGR